MCTPLDVEAIKLRASCLGSRLACVEIVKFVGTFGQGITSCIQDRGDGVALEGPGSSSTPPKSEIVVEYILHLNDEGRVV